MYCLALEATWLLRCHLHLGSADIGLRCICSGESLTWLLWILEELVFVSDSHCSASLSPLFFPFWLALICFLLTLRDRKDTKGIVVWACCCQCRDSVLDVYCHKESWLCVPVNTFGRVGFCRNSMCGSLLDGRWGVAMGLLFQWLDSWWWHKVRFC
jgi:hypothetical protein